jgi:HlyD family secretion protein
MQVEAAIDEADVGRLRPGLSATFTVDAFPRRSFSGEIVQIRKSPVTVQNVVSYTVVISARNPDFALLPGMTANVRIVVEQRDDALKVPNAALRFRPADATDAPPKARARAGAKVVEAERGARVWLPENRGARPVEVRLGLSDGLATEIVAGELKEGAEVIVGLAAAEPRGTGLPRIRLF